MQFTIEIPPNLMWLVEFYETKAEVRKRLDGTGRVEDEIVIAMEQQAIAGLEHKPVWKPSSGDEL